MESSEFAHLLKTETLEGTLCFCDPLIRAFLPRGGLGSGRMERIGSLWILLCAAREWALRKPRAIGRIISATRGGAAAVSVRRDDICSIRRTMRLSNKFTRASEVNRLRALRQQQVFRGEDRRRGE
jgi:hypothetical protein